jgi:hypothetical protein
MSTSALRSFDDIPDPHRGALTTRQRRGLAVIGAIAGALIGPMGFMLQVRLSAARTLGSDALSFPGSPARWARNLGALGSLGGVQVFAVCAFVATLALMPVLIRWLESRLAGDRRAYYVGAAMSGVVLGIVATMLTAWMLAMAALITGFATGSPAASVPTTVVGLIGGMFIFGPLVGLITPFFFILPIVGVGIPFGLVSGAAVRFLARSHPPA